MSKFYYFDLLIFKKLLHQTMVPFIKDFMHPPLGYPEPNTFSYLITCLIKMVMLFVKDIICLLMDLIGMPPACIAMHPNSLILTGNNTNIGKIVKCNVFNSNLIMTMLISLFGI